MYLVRFFRKKIITNEDLHREKKKQHDEQNTQPSKDIEIQKPNPLLKSTCDYCGKQSSRGKRLEVMRVFRQDLTLHPECRLAKTLEMEREENAEMEKNMRDIRFMEKQRKRLQDFQTLSYNLDSGLEAILVFDYSAPTKSKTRLFFSKENNTTLFSRDYLTNTTNNVIHFKIEPTIRKNAKLISGGNFDFNDSFDDGYSLVLNLKYGDQSLRKEIIDILSEEGFGCLPSDFTIHAHLNKNSPSEFDAKKLLSVIVDRITERVFNTE